ncbi:MAG: nodulation protein NfeD [Candidatus Caldarchaeum sp.]|nr:nodulation protein NfeD [Candidatus Caldarchaeum sp.]
MKIHLIVVVILLSVFTAYAQRPTVLWLNIEGYISSGTVLYVEEGIASARGYSAVLITLNTLGGSADAMLRIVEAIQSSDVPVIGFVFPPGGKAMSAGTYILLATHLAAMAPGTLIGSAQPVAGGEPVTDSKVLNFFAEKMGTLAETHGRNREEAIRIVTENKNFNHQSALEAGLIEAVAGDVEGLLNAIDGRVVKTLDGEKILRLANAQLVRKEPGLTSSVVSMLSDPLVSSLLISLGILMLLFGLSSPGWGGEVIGGLMIVLGLVGQGLNINIAGAFLAFLGAALLLYELLSPGFGVIGASGIISLTVGIILLGGYSPAPVFVAQEWFTSFQLTVIVIALFMAGFLGFLMFKSFKAQRKKPVEPELKFGRATEDMDSGKEGYVFVDGEYWKAKAVKPVKQNQRIKVVGKQGGFLLVEPEETT